MFGMIATWLLSHAPWLGGTTFRLIAALVLLGGVFFLGYRGGAADVRGDWDREKIKVEAQYQADLKARLEAAAKRQADDETKLALVSSELSEIRAQRDRLLGALRKANLTTTTEVPHVGPTCPDVRLSRSFRLCHDAALQGTAAGAEACAASGVPDAGRDRAVSSVDRVR